MSLCAELLGFVNKRCVNVSEFLGSRATKLAVAIDALFEEVRLIPFNSLARCRLGFIILD